MLTIVDAINFFFFLEIGACDSLRFFITKFDAVVVNTKTAHV